MSYLTKIRFLFLMLFLVYGSLLTARADTDEGADLFNLECMEDQDVWPLFFKSFGDDPLEIRFPSRPIVEDYGDVLAYTAVDTHVFPTAIYGFTCYKECITPPDPIEIFERVIKERSNSPIILLWKKMTSGEESYILDVISKTENHRVYRKDRVIITSCNVYCLFTIFFPNTPENHEYFVSSFKLD